MDEALSYWRHCKELTLHQAVLLIIGANPSNYSTDEETNPLPVTYLPVLESLRHAILERELPARAVKVRKRVGINNKPGEDAYEILSVDRQSLDVQATKVVVRDLKKWLTKNDMKCAFFFEDFDAQNYLDPKNEFYAPKLAAAVAAWQAVTSNPALRKGKSAKKAIIEWLKKNSKDFALTNEGIEHIAKVANWNPAGGAPKTPTVPQKKSK